MKRFWNFTAPPDSEEVELRIDGDIVDDENAWVYDWFGEACASPIAFRDELAKYNGKNISVWINSFGGDVAAAAGIYNALKNHNGIVTTKVDGVAASAASVIFMAGSKRLMSPVGTLMIHNPLTQMFGEAHDMRKVADVLDVIKDTIINAYQASGLKRTEIAQMMDDETYMSAQKAKSLGFATDILFDQVEGKAQQTTLNMNRQVYLNKASSSIHNYIIGHKAQLTDQKKEEEMEIKNVADLQKAFPEIAAQLEGNAVTAERERINALDALDDVKNEAIHKIVAKAKETGKTAKDIQEYVDIVKAVPVPVAPQPQNALLGAMIDDNKASGVNGVAADGVTGNKAAAIAVDQAKIKTFADLLKKR